MMQRFYAFAIVERGQQGWIYSTEGVMSAIPFSSYKDPPKIVVVKQRRDKVKNENG